MTHAELLEKLNNSTRLVWWLALHTVVELHKPRSGVVDWCESCQDLYPCRTIQDIAKELR